jgi:hypothetical protein
MVVHRLQVRRILPCGGRGCGCGRVPRSLLANPNRVALVVLVVVVEEGSSFRSKVVVQCGEDGRDRRVSRYRRRRTHRNQRERLLLLGLVAV